MATTAEAFQTAFRHHQAGQLREADALYRQILQADPKHFDALHLLGVVAYQVGRPDVAVELISRAIALRGDQAAFHGNLGEAYRVLGKFTQAEESLRRALALDPNLPDAHNSLGDVHRVMGRPVEAVASFGEAIRLRPGFAEAHNNLGTVLQAQRDLDGAVGQYRLALELKPRYVEAFINLGTAFQQRGNLNEAAACYRDALELAPGNCDAHLNLGTVFQEQRQIEGAIECYREALRHNPRSALAHSNLGAALKELKRYDEALAAFREALTLDPQSAEAQFNLGTALQGQQDWTAAADAFREALRLNPGHIKALVSLASVMQQQGRVDEALALVDRAIEIDPAFAKAHLNRANLYKLKSMSAQAIIGYQTALRLQPDYPEAYNNLAVLFNDLDQPDLAIDSCRKGLAQEPASAALFANMATALQNLGRLDEAIECARKSVELRPEGVGEHTNLLYKLNFHPLFDAPAIYREHLEWAARHAEPLTAQAQGHTNDNNSNRRLRIGYVSPYFRDHAVNFFSEPMIAAHDHRAFEVFCYSDVLFADAATRRLQSAADHWRDTRSLSDKELALAVRADRIDILVDLTGHIAGNRLLVFARKPAPIQVTYLGYQNTTGMSAMDYRLTDDWADPPGTTDRYYREQLVRLPRSFFCYRPSEDSPAVGPLPAEARGEVTFGSFNNFAKVGPRVVETWLELIQQVEASRLLVLARAGGSAQQRLQGLARARGVDPARIEFFDKRPRRAYLELFAEVDIALDPFPFNGHTTTCDAIWMGVPVVMLAGDAYASRFGGSVLRNVGLAHLIANDTERYVALAAELAGDLAGLARVRSEMRSRMAASPLLDATGFTRNLEVEYRRMWQRWCASADRDEDV